MRETTKIVLCDEHRSVALHAHDYRRTRTYTGRKTDPRSHFPPNAESCLGAAQHDVAFANFRRFLTYVRLPRLSVFAPLPMGPPA